jgi:septum formation inhibitor-activating ATPase MinD
MGITNAVVVINKELRMFFFFPSRKRIILILATPEANTKKYEAKLLAKRLDPKSLKKGKMVRIGPTPKYG